VAVASAGMAAESKSLSVKWAVAWIVLLLCPTIAPAGSPYEGIYDGSFIGDTYGDFVAMIKADSSSIIWVHDRYFDEGYRSELIVNANGSFSGVIGAFRRPDHLGRQPVDALARGVTGWTGGNSRGWDRIWAWARLSVWLAASPQTA
jgi:hypothetical protein